MVTAAMGPWLRWQRKRMPALRVMAKAAPWDLAASKLYATRRSSS